MNKLILALLQASLFWTILTFVATMLAAILSEIPSIELRWGIGVILAAVFIYFLIFFYITDDKDTRK